MRRTVVIGLVGMTKDANQGPKRWETWRPTVALAQQDDLLIDRLELLCEPKARPVAEGIAVDLGSASPETQVELHQVRFRDAWDFAEVFQVLLDWVDGYTFRPDEEDYLVHITTGTHVVQICWFLLVETHRIPARLLQTSPTRGKKYRPSGTYKIIDLDLSRYDVLARRFEDERREGVSLLKSGIETRDAAFNALMDRIEEVALASAAPLLLSGPTGVGKTKLAGRIYELKSRQRNVAGPFVEVNCATLRGDGAMSALFGHEKGAYTGALAKREGLLRRADRGLLFLDEIGELGLDEQAMLLRAIEEGIFLPVGADEPVESRFQLVAGSNRDLRAEVEAGRFREDLLARIDLWTFELPGLGERTADIEPNVDFELMRFEGANGRRVAFNREARERYLAFAVGPLGRWPANFRDLSASITRMATLARGGRIGMELVSEELERLRRSWRIAAGAGLAEDESARALGHEAAEALDRFDRVQLNDVLRVCAKSASVAAAGRELFAASIARRTSRNDSARLTKYLARFGLRFEDLD